MAHATLTTLTIRLELSLKRAFEQAAAAKTALSRNYCAITCALTSGTARDGTPLLWSAERLCHPSTFRVRQVGRCNREQEDA